jgi:hypothetical protein
MRSLAKAGIGAAALGVLVWLFLSTLQDTIAEPYEVDDTAFSGWTLVSRAPARGQLAALGLRPPQPLAPALFDQLFARTMASMTSPGDPMLPIVLASELQGELGIVLTPEEMLTVAADAGLERLVLRPVCMAVQREPFMGRTREFFFVLFDAPELAALRTELGAIAAERGVAGALDDPAFSFVLPVAASDAEFSSWWPLVVERETDCQAPVGAT